MSHRQTSQNGADASMSSQEASLVNLSLTPGGEEARKMTATSGRSLSALLPKCGPLGSLVRMLLESQRWSSPARLLFWEAKPLYSRRTTLFTDTYTTNPSPLNASAQTLNSSDMQSNRCLFRLVPSEHPTEETGSSSLPILKTPCTFDAQSERMKSASIPGSTGTLAQEVQNGMAAKRGLLLPTVIGVYKKNTDGGTSQLSPLFTEEMMGFPFLWTALPFLRTNGEQNHSKPTETP